MQIIKSKDNQIIKRYISHKLKKKRNESCRFVIEGYKFIMEAIRENTIIESMILSESFYKKEMNFVESIECDYCIYIADDRLIDKISDTENPQGILAEIAINNSLANKINEYRFILILDEIKDPGNMGTIIRSADAFEVDCIYITKGCVDIYNSKVLRSTMGSIFRVPIFVFENKKDLFDKFRSNGFTIYSTCLDGNKIDYFNTNTEKVVVIIGNESNGVSEELKKQSDYLIKIPISDKVESLNASIAASIIMYEFKRMKNLRDKG